MQKNPLIWECLIDIFLMIILWIPVNLIMHEVGHLIPFLLSDFQGASWKFAIGPWRYTGTLSGFGFVPALYLTPLMIFMGGWLAGITAILIYRKLSFSKNPILKTAMLHSAIWQYLYSCVEGMANAEWLAETYHNINLSMVLAVPLTMIYIMLIYYEQKQKKKNARISSAV